VTFFTRCIVIAFQDSLGRVHLTAMPCRHPRRLLAGFFISETMMLSTKQPPHQPLRLRYSILQLVYFFFSLNFAYERFI
jgi:hypothetical protein